MDGRKKMKVKGVWEVGSLCGVIAVKMLWFMKFMMIEGGDDEGLES